MDPHTDVLLVDDEPDVRRLLRETLERAGYRVECAVDGVDAAVALDRCKPRLVISDLVMPNRDGLTLIRDIRARNIDVKIVAISGGSRAGHGPDLASALDAGADAVLTKPFGARELARIVQGFLSSGSPGSTKV